MSDKTCVSPECCKLRKQINEHWGPENARLKEELAAEKAKYAALTETLSPHSVGFVMAQLIAEQEEHAEKAEAERDRVVNTHKGLMQRVEAERDALKADAERYRWLRNSDEGIEFRDFDGAWRSDCPSGNELDAAIDAARNGAPKT